MTIHILTQITRKVSQILFSLRKKRKTNLQQLVYTSYSQLISERLSILRSNGEPDLSSKQVQPFQPNVVINIHEASLKHLLEENTSQLRQLLRSQRNKSPKQSNRYSWLLSKLSKVSKSNIDKEANIIIKAIKTFKH